ncbi:C40 family peptidase [Hymenobacter guriensis]|uniref:C40 family peptidase n=1 Tax=Hymenobacter guriensis TaxID=2793065 RepID=A0ABS0L057_9BACT|nr:C40 family peptidase [Hymenobacter guriensis]MBG8553496.1 C40 family peptidase [Hymenobacter guriensis]
MRIVWSVFLLLVVAILGSWLYQRQPAPVTASTAVEMVPVRAVADQSAATSMAYFIARPPRKPVAVDSAARADSLVRFALRQLGTNYLYAGISPETGFDCSGFVSYVFGHYGIAVPHSTALLISTGREVPRAEARPGDIVVFTGTAATSTTPGHAGIVLSKPGEPIRFVHASSARRESGVKISEVENTDYERRFMAIRRVLQ